MPDYRRLSFRLSDPLEDELTAELWARGSIGMELRADGDCTILDAYFDVPPGRTLASLPPTWAARGVRLVHSETVEETDWLAVHRSVSRPFEIGDRWLVDPREPDGLPPQVAGRETLRIPARRAFGTGSHESTRLLLEWMEDLSPVGRRVLDVGTGSGILALAAERLGATCVVGIDPDPVAVCMAHQNCRLNGGSCHLAAARLSEIRGRTFDMALINILPREWLDEAPHLSGALSVGATVLLSGIPTEEGEGFVTAMTGCGLAVREARHAGEWVAYRAEVLR